MIGLWIKDLTALRAMDEFQPGADVRQWVDGIRTNISYNAAKDTATESFAFLREIPDFLQELMLEYPDVADVFTPEEIAGYYATRVRTEEDGVVSFIWSDPVPPLAEARAAYDSCYDRSSYTDEEGNTITPPFWFGKFAGSIGEYPHLLEPL